MNGADVLDDAALLIYAEGWFQIHMVNPSDHCLYTAIMSAGKKSVPARQEALAALNAKIGPPVNWNDKKGRTFTEVIDLLSASADSLREYYAVVGNS